MVFISDLHIPYEDKKAVELVIKFLEDFKPEVLILGGDLIDFMGLSRFSKDPKRALTTQNDIDTLNKLLVVFRSILPDSDIVYLEGNHEYRMTNYKWTKCPELTYIKALQLPKLLGLDTLNITFIPYTKYYNYKKLYFVHGDVISKHSGQTAKQMLDKWGLALYAVIRTGRANTIELLLTATRVRGKVVVYVILTLNILRVRQIGKQAFQ